MKISVVIPAYNEEKTISQTIEAVLAEDYPDFEVIIVNNASTDKTAEFVSKYPVTLVTESRKGLLWAREKGRLSATGDIIANIDADCLPEKNWLSCGARLFTDDHIAAVSGPYDYYDGKKLFRTTSLFLQKYLYKLANSILQLPFIQTGAVLIGGNNLIRSSVLEKMGGYNTSITFYGEDTNTAKRVATFGRVIFDSSLIMKTSNRRFKNEGLISITLKYWYYFFRTLFTKK